jgi:hypothetical protein
VFEKNNWTDSPASGINFCNRLVMNQHFYPHQNPRHLKELSAYNCIFLAKKKKIVPALSHEDLWHLRVNTRPIRLSTELSSFILLKLNEGKSKIFFSATT